MVTGAADGWLGNGWDAGTVTPFPTVSSARPDLRGIGNGVVTEVQVVQAEI
jgi:hypothetical protein